MSKRPLPSNMIDVSKQEVQEEDDSPATSSAVDYEMEDRVSKRETQSPLPPQDVAAGLEVAQTEDPTVKVVTGVASDGTEIMGVRVPIEDDRTKEPPPPKNVRAQSTPNDVRRSQAGVQDHQIEQLLGPKLYNQIVQKARGNNIASIADYFCQNLYHAINTGAFSGVEATEKRNGSDREGEIRSALGTWITDRIVTEAVERGFSNVSVLTSGVQRLINQNLI